jgi:repressor LexA
MRELTMAFRNDSEAEKRPDQALSGSASSVPAVVLELVAGSPEIPILEETQSKHNLFVFRVKGPGLSQDHIVDGDYLIVERWAEPKEGDLLVRCFPEGAIALGRFLGNDRGTGPASANACHPAPEVDPQAVAVQGIVVGILRKYGGTE